METDAILNQLEGQTSGQEQLQLSFEELFAPLEDSKTPARQSNGQAHPAPARKAASPAAQPAPSVSGRHQDVRLFVTVLLKTFVEQTDSGIVREAPFEVRLDDGLVCQPDVIFVSHSSFERMHDQYMEGSPDVIVEVLSADSTAADRGEKFVLYEKFRAREYWLIDPVRELAYFYCLGPDNLYDDTRPDTAGRLRSRVLKGFVLDVGKLWGRVLPTTVETVEMVQAMVNTR